MDVSKMNGKTDTASIHLLNKSILCTYRIPEIMLEEAVQRNAPALRETTLRRQAEVETHDCGKE